MLCIISCGVCVHVDLEMSRIFGNMHDPNVARKNVTFWKTRTYTTLTECAFSSIEKKSTEYSVRHRRNHYLPPHPPTKKSFLLQKLRTLSVRSCRDSISEVINFMGPAKNKIYIFVCSCFFLTKR